LNYTDNFTLDYVNLADLEYIDNELKEVRLYFLGNFVGFLEVWTDWENDQREYIIINNEVIYLDKIKQIHSWI
jgi:hypothetical protein